MIRPLLLLVNGRLCGAYRSIVIARQRRQATAYRKRYSTDKVLHNSGAFRSRARGKCPAIPQSYARLSPQHFVRAKPELLHARRGYVTFACQAPSRLRTQFPLPPELLFPLGERDPSVNAGSFSEARLPIRGRPALFRPRQAPMPFCRTRPAAPLADHRFMHECQQASTTPSLQRCSDLWCDAMNSTITLHDPVSSR